jgi:hypothetical protein
MAGKTEPAKLAEIGKDCLPEPLRGAWLDLDYHFISVT